MYTTSLTRIGRIGQAHNAPQRSATPSLRLGFEGGDYQLRAQSTPLLSLLNFSRSSSGSYIDADGQIQIAAIDVPRLDYSTGRQGLLLEEARTNVIAYSSDFTRDWTLNRDSSGTGQRPRVNEIDSDMLQDLPDASQGSEAGKGFTIVGLAYDQVDDAFWAGNIARATPGAGQGTPQLVQLSLDGTTVLNEINVAHTMQGVAYDGLEDRLYYAAPVTGKVYKIEKDGSGEGVLFDGLSALNALSYDALRDALWVSEGTDLKRYSKAGALQQTIALGFTADHIMHDRDKDWLWVTYGSSGAAGFLRAVRVSDGSTVKIYTLHDAYAIEGVVVKDNTLYIANDGYHHFADIADPAYQKNQLQIYPMDYGLIPDSLPDYLRIEKGAGAGGVDTSWMQLNVSADAQRCFGCYFKAAHAAETPRFTMRMDDGTSVALEHITPDDQWQRYEARKTDGASDQSIKLIARGSAPYSSDDVARVWAQAADVQSGSFLTSHIPTSGAIASRSTDNAVIDSSVFSAFYNPREGSVAVDFTPLNVPEANQYGGIVNFNDGSGNERISLVHRHTSGVVRADIISSGSGLPVGSQALVAD